MFGFLKRLFIAKPHPATRRVMQSITSERERALTARDDNRTIAEHVAHLQRNSQAPIPVHVPLPLDQDTIDRLRRKAENGGRPTPIWPIACRFVVANNYDTALARLKDIFAPNPVPDDVSYIGSVHTCHGLRNATVMVVEVNTPVIIDLHLQGAHLIDPYGKPLDLAGIDDSYAAQRGRDMAESARKREEDTAIPMVIPLQAADLPDFHSCRYTEDPKPFEGGGGSFGGGGASGGWDENNQTGSVGGGSLESPRGYEPDSSGSVYSPSPSYDSSPSSDSGSGSIDMGSPSSGDGW